MSNIVIEHGKCPGEINRIWRILTELDYHFVPPLSERVDIKTYAAKIARHADCFYARTGGLDIGACFVYLNSKETGYITSIGVYADYQRMGAGSLLLGAVVNEAGNRNLKEINLKVHSNNPKAVRFYTSFGFRAIASEGPWYLMTYRVSRVSSP